jgi:inositol oxygenase
MQATLVNKNFQSNKEIFYRRHHQSQTLEKATELRDKYDARIIGKATVWERLMSLRYVNDESDSDLEGMTQLGHALQTANAIVAEDLDEDWIILGLVHDLGKIIQSYGEKPEFVVGDVYPVGCQFGKSIVYYDFLRANSDWEHPVYSTKYGIYEPNCGLENVVMSYGHDEYMYRILKDKVPHAVAWTIRHHSFQSVAEDYTHLMNEQDRELRETHMKRFVKYDLYTKNPQKVAGRNHLKYYQEIIERRFPEPLNW